MVYFSPPTPLAPFRPRKETAFSLVELLIGLALTSIVALMAYRTFAPSQKKLTTTYRDMKVRLEVLKFGTKLENEIENTVGILTGGGTALGNLTSTACGSNPVPSALVPYPHRLRDKIDLLPSDPKDPLALISPADPPSPADDSDAIRFAYFPPESQPRKVVALVTGLDPITVEAGTGDAPFQTGDFALITDGTSSDIVRITHVRAVGATYLLNHDDAQSGWNKPFTHEYPASSIETAVVMKKVRLITYALHSDHNLYFHDHVNDDGFVPASGSYGGTPGVAPVWELALPSVASFHVFYTTSDHSVPESPGQPPGTRTPRAAFTDTPNAPTPCANELGDPLLKRIWFGIQPMNENDELVRTVVPLNILTGADLIVPFQQMAVGPGSGSFGYDSM